MFFRKKGNQSKKKEKKNIRLIDQHMDRDWYVRMFNIDTNEITPAKHFYLYGYKEGKNPTPDFDVNWYVNEYVDVKQSGMNPFIHYVLYGKSEGRYPNEGEKEKAVLQQVAHKQFSKKDSHNINNLLSNEIEKEEKQFFQYLYESNRGSLKSFNIDKKVKIVSFDIWDTLLRRKTYPDEIKFASARFVYINYIWKLKPAYRDIYALYKARLKSENVVSLTDDFEYRYSEAINVWLVQVFERGTKVSVLEKIRQQLLEHELKAEMRSTDKDVKAVDFLKTLKTQQLIFCSDFYMPKNFIIKLLQNHKINSFFTKGYVSCDLVKNKRSGSLFEHVMNEFESAPEEILHVGDNKKADVDIPKGKGINVFYYEDEKEKQLYKWFEDAFVQKQMGNTKIHGERVLSLCKFLTEKYQLDDKERVGSLLAPLAVGYILHIIEEAKKLDVDTVYFFTREGVFIKELYDLVVESDPYFSDYPKSEILEVSRLATFAPSLEKVDRKSLMRLWSQYSTQSPKAFCASLNIDTDSMKKIFEDEGFSYEKAIVYPWQNENFVALIESEKFQRIIKEHLDSQRENLIEYLSIKGLNQGQSVSMVVDLGWRGTIQDNIAKIVKEHVHGCYLGLFKFINPQENTSKTGYIFDNNAIENDWNYNEVGPIEMLFNTLGGSVIGYERKDGNIVVRTKKETEEDRVYETYTHYFQSGIKKVLKDVVDYVAVHALVASDLKPISRDILLSILKNPPSEFAEAFFELTHNETFGTGEYQSMKELSSFIENLETKEGSELHHFVSENMKKIRWKDGFLNLSDVSEKIQESKHDLTNTPIEFYKKMFFKDKDIELKVALYAPAPIVGSGGHRTLFNLAKKFVDAGCEVFCFLEDVGSGIETVYDYLGNRRAHVYVGWPNNIEFDMAIATIAHSAEFVHSLKFVKHKAYLVQDFEAWFNPIGDTYTVNENSYTYGLLHFTVGKFLTHLLHHQYGASAVPAGLGIDTNVYHDKGEEREDALCFLYQPEKFRRNPELAIKALKIVKEKRPDIKIYVYGSDADLYIDFEVENLGLVRDLSVLNNLYNKCKVGLCISMTNPSRIPFEYMASGVVPVDVYRYNNLVDYPSGTIKLAYQSADSIAEAILELFENEDECKKRKEAGKVFSSTRSLDWEMDTFVNNALRVMHNMQIDNFDVEGCYEEEPVIALKDKRKEVAAFCEWQRNLVKNSNER